MTKKNTKGKTGFISNDSRLTDQMLDDVEAICQFKFIGNTGDLESDLEAEYRMEIRAKKVLVDNYKKAGQLWVAPSWPHYKDATLWDAGFQAIVLADLSSSNPYLFEMSENELHIFFAHQHKDGFIPHAIFWERKSPRFSERGHYIKSVKESNYTQPPVFGQALGWVNLSPFAEKYFEGAVNFYCYFLEKQDPDKDNLISVCHPHETGRDSSPEADHLLNIHLPPNQNWLPRQINAVDRWKKILKLDAEYKKVNWDIEKIWKLDLFNIEDVMLNCIWVQGMRSLANLSRQSGTKTLLNVAADQVEKAILKNMYSPEDKFFYSLDSQNQMIKIPSIAGLFPLILEHIPRDLVEILFSRLTNPEEFYTPYPIPSVPRNSPFFDPGKHTASCSWRGPTWINMCWFIVQGLLLQWQRFNERKYAELALEIIQKNWEMVEREGFWEFYNPLTGKGLRIKNFGWSTLVINYPRMLAQERDNFLTGQYRNSISF